MPRPAAPTPRHAFDGGPRAARGGASAGARVRWLRRGCPVHDLDLSARPAAPPARLPPRLAPPPSACRAQRRALRVPVAQRPMPVFWRRLQMQASGAATPRARRRANVRCGVAAGRFGGHAHSGPLARAFFATVVAHEDARAVRSTWAKLNKILQSEGVGELYRGLGSSLLCLAVSNFVYFYWYATPRACVPARGGSTSCTCCIAVFTPRSMQQAVLTHIFHEGKRPAPLPLCLALERGMRHDFSCGCEYAAGTTSSRRD